MDSLTGTPRSPVLDRPPPRGGGRGRFRRWAPVFAGGVVVLVAVMLWGAFGTTIAGSGGAEAKDPGPSLPAFSVDTLSGGVFSFPTSRPTAIYFTGATCASCLPKAAALDRIEREVDGAVTVLGVDIDGFDTEEMFRDWIAHAGSPRHAFAMDRSFQLLDLFEVTALSTVVITDGAGRQVWRSADDVGAGELRRALAEAGLR